MSNQSKDYSFAPLNTSQLDEVKKTESQLNNAAGSAGEEIILLAYRKDK